MTGFIFFFRVFRRSRTNSHASLLFALTIFFFFSTFVVDAFNCRSCAAKNDRRNGDRGCDRSAGSAGI